jgi:hypothetical protein
MKKWHVDGKVRKIGWDKNDSAGVFGQVLCVMECPAFGPRPTHEKAPDPLLGQEPEKPILELVGEQKRSIQGLLGHKKLKWNPYRNICFY